MGRELDAESLERLKKMVEKGILKSLENMNKGNKTGTWKIDLEVNTVVLATNEGLNRGGAGEED